MYVCMRERRRERKEERERGAVFFFIIVIHLDVFTDIVTLYLLGAGGGGSEGLRRQEKM